MKKIVVINGHPNKESFNHALANAYIEAATNKGAEVKYISIGELDFNPNLEFGYQKRMELEPDLINALETIKWSNHQVWIHPIWWLGMPAIMKGFFDRAFLPNITFKTIKGEATQGLLTSDTARIITTAGDLSYNEYEKTYHLSGLVQLQKGILEYCGISSIENNFIGPLNDLTENDRLQWIERIKEIAINDAI